MLLMVVLSPSCVLVELYRLTVWSGFHIGGASAIHALVCIDLLKKALQLNEALDKLCETESISEMFKFLERKELV